VPLQSITTITTRVASVIIFSTVLLLVAAPAPAIFAENISASITPGSSTKTDDAYSPNPLNIRVGDSVTWTNDDTMAHTVTSGTGSADPNMGQEFDSSPGLKTLMTPQATFSHMFETAGEFPYFCVVHPNMVGTVVVASSSSVAGEGGTATPTLNAISQQSAPTNATEQQQQPITMEVTSTEDSFVVRVNWTHADIGQPNTFAFQFFDPDMQPIQQPIYDIVLLQGNQTVNGTLREEQTSPAQQYTFNETGNYTLRIHNVQDRRPSDVVDIPLQVMPEFPTGMLAATIMMVPLLGAIIFFTRPKGSRRNHYNR
jgi:plastocyanin